jgi:hypothetical protein|tara:strand:+ start:10270 stop:10647 length:378 start_codon:yes stop_codon:yes gene_type:complete
MSVNRRIIAQKLFIPATDSKTIYTVPESTDSKYGMSKHAVISSLVACNLTASQSLVVAIRVVKSGNPILDPNNIILGQRPLAPDETIVFPLSLTLESGDSVYGVTTQILAGSGLLNIGVYGREID